MTDPLSRLSAALADKYRIERELGAGGMATVYLAADLKHDRQVAVKVLRPELAAVIGADRFLSEIKTTANLQHPHILPLFDSGEADGFLFYVMPFITGETVRDRLTREQQLPVADAVRIATEVAAALDYAHRHGIIHRDIKPENILIHDGSALVADFGIALAASKAGGTRMTETGMSLGTPHYMSPEQAMGDREITARSDVYALGCVTYEMLAGEPPFTGPTAQSIIARVMTEDPRTLSGQRKTIPPGVEAAVMTALEKLPADRFGTAAEFAAALANPTTTTLRPGFQPAAASKRRNWLMAGALALVTLVAGYLIGHRTPNPGSVGPDEVVRASLALGDSVVVRAIATIRLAIDPAGRRIAFVGPDGAGSQLWVRELNQPVAHPLPDTKGAFAPFFSPDGQSIGFYTSVGGPTKLMVTTLAGGVPRLVADSVPDFGGGSWGDDGNIYFTTSARVLAKVPAGGGTAITISHIDSASGVKEHDFPDVLPGGRYALVMLWKGSAGANHIGLVNLNDGEVTDLTEGTYARYAAPGFLIIGMADGQLRAARFDPRKGRLTSAPLPVLQRVQRETTNGTIQFAVSATGTLVYAVDAGDNDGFRWVSRTGLETTVDTAMKGIFPNMALSPDGRQIAVTQGIAGETQVWIKQLSTRDLQSALLRRGQCRPPGLDPRRAPGGIPRHPGRPAYRLDPPGGRHRHAQLAAQGNTRLDEITFDPSMRYTCFVPRGRRRAPGTCSSSRTARTPSRGPSSSHRSITSRRPSHLTDAGWPMCPRSRDPPRSMCDPSPTSATPGTPSRREARNRSGVRTARSSSTGPHEGDVCRARDARPSVRPRHPDAALHQREPGARQLPPRL
ncbi:MAG: protein kinase [Gemmatimonadales bacterium]